MSKEIVNIGDILTWGSISIINTYEIIERTGLSWDPGIYNVSGTPVYVSNTPCMPYGGSAITYFEICPSGVLKEFRYIEKDGTLNRDYSSGRTGISGCLG